jgi:RimJ/RimL family protein N-acetyltransferase
MLPELHTPRLVLRPAADSDTFALLALWNTPDVRRYLWDDVHVTQQRAAETVQRSVALTHRGLGLWVVLERDGTADAAFVGAAGLLPVSAVAGHDPGFAGRVEPIVALMPSARGRGLATEALRAVLQYALGQLRLPGLVSVIDAPNDRAHRLVARIGSHPILDHDAPSPPVRSYRLSSSVFASMATERNDQLDLDAIEALAG